MAGAKRYAGGAPGRPHTLLDLWEVTSRGSFCFPALAGIATVPLFSRRFRDRHPIVCSTRSRHGCANAEGVAGAIAATGRDWSRFGGEPILVGLPPARREALRHLDECHRRRSAYIELTTTGETATERLVKIQ